MSGGGPWPGAPRLRTGRRASTDARDHGSVEGYWATSRPWARRCPRSLPSGHDGARDPARPLHPRHDSIRRFSGGGWNPTRQLGPNRLLCRHGPVLLLLPSKHPFQPTGAPTMEAGESLCGFATDERRSSRL